MLKNSTRYTEEFKQQIIDLRRSAITVTSLSCEYGLSIVTIYKGLKNLSHIEIYSKESLTAKEFQAMKKRISQLEMENEILKKATAIFAKKH